VTAGTGPAASLGVARGWREAPKGRRVPFVAWVPCCPGGHIVVNQY